MARRRCQDSVRSTFKIPSFANASLFEITYVQFYEYLYLNLGSSCVRSCIGPSYDFYSSHRYNEYFR